MWEIDISTSSTFYLQSTLFPSNSLFSITFCSFIRFTTSPKWFPFFAEDDVAAAADMDVVSRGGSDEGGDEGNTADGNGCDSDHDWQLSSDEFP